MSALGRILGSFQEAAGNGDGDYGMDSDRRVLRPLFWGQFYDETTFRENAELIIPAKEEIARFGNGRRKGAC